MSCGVRCTPGIRGLGHATQLIGILSPLVLRTGRLFSGPNHAPTLEAQYVTVNTSTADVS